MMSHNINYAHMEKFFSPARIGAISSSLNTSLTPKQAIGMLFWEQQVASSIYPIIQIIEVSLRNSMNEVLKSRFGNSWWNNLRSTSSCNSSPKCRCSLCSLKKSIKKAENRFKKEYARSKGANYNNTVALDDIISQTELSVWEDLLSTSLYAPNSKQNGNYLYPKSLNKMFKGIPALYPSLNGNATQVLLNIKTLVYNVRLLRNRISHHDRLWTKSHLIGNSSKRKKDIINSISRKIDDIKNLALVISPELLKMIENWGLFNNIDEILSLDVLEKYLDEEFFKFSSKQEQDMFFIFYSEYAGKSYSISRDVVGKTLQKHKGI